MGNEGNKIDLGVKFEREEGRVFRFAPSPNGYLHLGHALSALLNADRARASGGRLLLRIEDIDLARCRPEYEAAIYEDLAWLGLRWEQPVRRQSEHLDEYRSALARLKAMGLVYPAFESRAEIARLVREREAHGSWPRDPDGSPLYPGTAKRMPLEERARRVAAGQPYAWRLDMQAALVRIGSILADASPFSSPPQGGKEEIGRSLPQLTWSETGEGPDEETGTISADPAAWGDVVLARKDVPGSYHLAVVVDDAAQGVTDVVRGRDLFHATSVHRLLQALLDLPTPRYYHHRLLLDAQGLKLSKSTRATGLRALRAQGLNPNDIRRLAGLA